MTATRREAIRANVLLETSEVKTKINIDLEQFVIPATERG